ncbi:MAG: monovalent cation:proton antiporter-2 (CPA2) family protein [Sandaracinaceae bacterium]
MHDQGFFFQAFVYLSAAVVSVPLAKRLGLGSVLGYLLAGIAIGPFALGLVGEEGQDVMHFAEFGVVMMLFLVGLELEPALLWRLRFPILGLGGSQVLVTAAAVTGLAVALGLSWPEGLAVGMTLALSSTAIVLQTLDEKGLMKTAAGQSSFAVLLFQDIAVIPMLALFPLLATHHLAAEHGGDHGGTAIGGLPAWAQTLAVLGAVGAVVAIGRYAMRPVFRFIARTRLRELFVAAALLLVIGTALLMAEVGLSPALGTFVAGVVLANSEYRHELESDIEPFKGLLLGLFFIAVGASIDFQVVAASPGTIAVLVLLLVAVKIVVLAVLGRVFGLTVDQNLLFAFALAQGGEFAFVLFSFANQSGVLTDEVTAPLMVVVAVSMALTPVILLFFERVVQPRVGTLEKVDRPFEAPEERNEVIIAGFGRFGQICGRLLAAEGVRHTVLEYDSDQVDLLRKFGRKVYYGDARRYDLLAAAGAAEARLLILAIDHHDRLLTMVETARKHFPHLTILARAIGRTEAYDLIDAGVDHVYRETFDSSLRLGVDALRLLGHRAYHAHRAARRFRQQDEALLRELAGKHRDQDFVGLVRRRSAEVEEILQDDLDKRHGPVDEGWDVETLRADRDLGGRSSPSGPSAAST